MNARTHDDMPAVPRWAKLGWLTAFGAPLIGVPMLVGLLSLGSWGDVGAAAGSEAEQVTVTAQVGAEDGIELPPVTLVGDRDVRG